MAESLNIAILGGSGQVGSRLASRLCLAGNNVILASRNPEDPKVVEVVTRINDGSSGSVSAADVKVAASRAQAIIIAVPGINNPKTWEQVLGAMLDYSGVVIDATNPLSTWPGLEINIDHSKTSASEDLQSVLTRAQVFKAFNTVGAELMTRPTLNGRKIQLLYAGAEDNAAKELTEKIIKAVGYEPQYVGPLRYARNLESIAELWVHLAVKQNWKRDSFAFEITKEQ